MNLGERPTMESDRHYYSRRAVQEKLAAARSITTKAREWHTQLAEGFSRKAGQIGEYSAAE
jgi:hypothetical protein